MRDFQAGDHIHPVGYADGDTLEPITGPDWDAIDREAFGVEAEPQKPVEMADAAAAFSLLLEFICQAKEPNHIAARALALLYYLSPETSRYDSMEAIAQACGCTKQAVSKSLMQLRRASGAKMCFKLAFSSESYSAAQKAAVRAGVHSSFVRKDRKQQPK